MVYLWVLYMVLPNSPSSNAFEHSQVYSVPHIGPLNLFGNAGLGYHIPDHSPRYLVEALVDVGRAATKGFAG